MAKTHYIGLELTTDPHTLFENWRLSINGQGDSEHKSNAQLIDEAIGGLQEGKQNKIDNEHKLSYALLSDTPDLSHFIDNTVNNLRNYYLKTETYTQSETDSLLSNKQDIISDLQTIRNNASLGATAVQPEAISDMATKTWVTSQGYLTQHQSLAAYRTASDQDVIDNSKQPLLIGTGAGQNIKTINGESLLGSGNIEIIVPPSPNVPVIDVQVDGVSVLDNKIAKISFTDYRTSAAQDIIDATKSSVSVSDTGTATDEIKYITVDGVEKKITGTNVEANPTEEATEDLTKVKINGTVFDIQGGSGGDVSRAEFDRLLDYVTTLFSMHDLAMANALDEDDNIIPISGEDEDGNDLTLIYGMEG